MKTVLALSILLAVAQVAQAADIEAGKDMVATVCAACHGANGVSVSETTIPNLAGQRVGYLEAQLKAFKDGTRKAQAATSPTAIMNAIATQLTVEDIANVAAYFASQPGAAAGAKSAFLPNVAKTGVTFPKASRTVHEVPHHQLPHDQAGAPLLRQPGRGGGGEGGQAAARRLGAVRRSVCGET